MKNKKEKGRKVETDSAPPPSSGMSDDQLIAFNPILAKAFDQYVDKNDPIVRDVMKQLVAAALKTGAEPEKIFALIKTGRLLTNQNMKFLSKADIKEWKDAGAEYRRLAKQD